MNNNNNNKSSSGGVVVGKNPQLRLLIQMYLFV